MDLEGPGGGGRAMLLSLPEGVLRLITGAADPHAELFFLATEGFNEGKDSWAWYPYI